MVTAVLFAALMAAGCGTASQPAAVSSTTMTTSEIAISDCQTEARSRFTDPDSVHFFNLDDEPHGITGRYVRGQINAKNRAGAYGGFKNFSCEWFPDAVTVHLGAYDDVVNY